MNDKHTANPLSERQYCMERGTIVGIVCCGSFLCSMYGLHNSLLGLFSNVLGLTAFVIAVRSIRKYHRQVSSLSFARACWMSLMLYGYAILLTAAVQYAYFAYLDHGMMREQIEAVLSMPEYKQLIDRMTAGGDSESMIQSTLEAIASPAKATMQLMWMNAFVALVMSLPTALLGRGLLVPRD